MAVDRPRLGHAPRRDGGDARHRRRPSPAELAELMVGRRVLLRVEKAPRAARRAAARGRGPRRSSTSAACCASPRSSLRRSRAGEIVGIAGVAGNGQTELLEALAGMRRPVLGTIRLDGRTHRARRSSDPHAHAASSACCMCRRTGCASGSFRPFAAFESAILGFTDDPRLRRRAAPRSPPAWSRDLARQDGAATTSARRRRG